MKRRIFNAIAAMSAVLCVATVALWASSYLRACSLGDPQLLIAKPEPRRYTCPYVAIHRGEFVIGYRAYDFSPGHVEPEYDFTGPAPPPESLRATELQFLGFTYESHPYYLLMAERRLTVPMWFLGLLFGATPLIFLIKFVRQRRVRSLIRRNICPECGYDLRATPDRCPECGAVPKRVNSSL